MAADAGEVAAEEERFAWPGREFRVPACSGRTPHDGLGEGRAGTGGRREGVGPTGHTVQPSDETDAGRTQRTLEYRPPADAHSDLRAPVDGCVPAIMCPPSRPAII